MSRVQWFRQAGSRSILPGERFHVKVIQTAKVDYVDRDVEFASARALFEKLAEINALPVGNEQDVDRVIWPSLAKSRLMSVSKVRPDYLRDTLYPVQLFCQSHHFVCVFFVGRMLQCLVDSICNLLPRQVFWMKHYPCSKFSDLF